MRRVVKIITVYLAAVVGLALFSSIAYGIFAASIPSVGAMLSAVCMAPVGYIVGWGVRKITMKNENRIHRENS